MKRYCLSIFAVLIAGCGGSGGSSSDAAPADSASLARGTALHKRLGCAACHAPDGRGTAPAYAGTWGREAILNGDRRVVRDRAYFRRALLEPSAEVVAGYPASMPAYGEHLQARDLDDLFSYWRDASR